MEEHKEIADTWATLGWLLKVKSVVSGAGLAQIASMLYWHKELCEYGNVILTVFWVVYFLGVVIQGSMSVWETSSVLAGYVLARLPESTLLKVTSAIGLLLAVVQFIGLVAFGSRRHMDLNQELCNLTSRSDGFVQPRWLGTEIVPLAVMLLLNCIGMWLNARVERAYRGNIVIYE